MRRLLVPAVVLLVGSWIALSQGRVQEEPVPATVPELAPVPSSPRVLGVSTCASAACHNANGDLGSQGSEYSTWIAVDPHARAYQALFNDTSKRIQRNLLGNKDGPPAHKSQLCLMCHGLGANVPQALHADGAGCEQCHGPAEKWKNTHYLRDFKRDTQGFHDLRDSQYARAKSCMKCHVGDGTREVNHDLIAAGHPRLKFEYAAFYANYPRHWTYREVKERKDDPGREARNWLVGQVVSAESALELLADRASRAPKHAQWPEFSEYDCSACHHALTSPSERQKRLAERAEAARKLGRKFRVGDLPWGTWYASELELLADRAPAKGGPEILKLLREIDEEMRERFPDTAKVRAKATKAAALLRDWAKAEARRPAAELNKVVVRDLMGRVAKNEGRVLEGWDGGTQTYLGLAALNHALVDMAPRFRDGPYRGPLLEMRNQLRAAFPPETRPLYDSPTNYRPDELLELMKKFR